MKYSEIFYTIQGEGKLIGMPSVFFRTSYCNLRCVWCDTPYTSWKPDNFDINIGMATKQILRHRCQYVVITGGEPFIQHQELGELCNELEGCHVTIETNATVFSNVNADLISMSPKLSNSIPIKDDKWRTKHANSMWEIEVIDKFIEKYDYQLKFVVEGPEDLGEVTNLLDKLHTYVNSNVFLMPQARTREELAEKQEWIASLCKIEGFRYSPRMHIDIWGTKRGV